MRLGAEGQLTLRPSHGDGGARKCPWWSRGAVTSGGGAGSSGWGYSILHEANGGTQRSEVTWYKATSV